MGLSNQENALIARADTAPMRAQVERWAAINSGTGNLAGLADMVGLLSEAC
jgi:glutamate carboxypeptidase